MVPQTILPKIRVNAGKTGVSFSVGKKGATVTKKVLSYKSATATPESTEVTPRSGGFNLLALFIAIIGLEVASADIHWVARIIGGIFALAGILIFLIDTASNPKWLWILPVISAVALYGGGFPWWVAGIHWLIIIIAVFCLICKFVPLKCHHLPSSSKR